MEPACRTERDQPCSDPELRVGTRSEWFDTGRWWVGGLLAVKDTVNGTPLCGLRRQWERFCDGQRQRQQPLANYEYGPFGELLRASGPMAKATRFDSPPSIRMMNRSALLRLSLPGYVDWKVVEQGPHRRKRRKESIWPSFVITLYSDMTV